MSQVLHFPKLLYNQSTNHTNSLHTKIPRTINDNYQTQSIITMPISILIKLTNTDNKN